MEKYAKIISLDEFEKIRESLGKIVCTSGGFDPIHPGHCTCIIESKQYGDTLVVVVNGDDWAIDKKGKPFMDLNTRCHIVSCIREVDYVIPFEINDSVGSICEALRRIRPHVFAKGGDRDHTNIPEYDVCQEFNIEIISNVGLEKKWASSDFLKEWGEFWENNK